LSYSQGKHIAVVSEPFCVGDCNQFRVYHIDLHEPSIRLLTKFTRPERYCHFAFAEGLLATGWVEGDKYFLGIKKVPLSTDDPEQEVILDLGHYTDFSLMTILCPHMILLSAPESLYLYAIPELSQTLENGVSPIRSATPLAEHHEGLHDPSGKSIQDALCTHHEGRRSTLTFSADYKCCLVVLPSPGQNSDTLVEHTVGAYISHGPSRTIWLENCCDDTGNVVLGGSTHCTKPDNYSGYARLGRSGAPDTSRTWHVPLGIQLGDVEDLSWDELSGKVSIVSSLDGERSLVLVDLV